MTVVSEADQIAELLGRPPLGGYVVALRAPDGRPLVLRNEPILADGTPMPTRFWLLDPEIRRRVGRLESEGGVRRAEAEVDPQALEAAHRAYAAERDTALPAGHQGPSPSGGVGGTRRGVKCLHAHYAYFLVGGSDPVGAWVDQRLAPGDGADR